jgi:hypothetical protein
LASRAQAVIAGRLRSCGVALVSLIQQHAAVDVQRRSLVSRYARPLSHALVSCASRFLLSTRTAREEAMMIDESAEERNRT